MKKLFTLSFLALSVTAFSQTSPGGVGTTNLTAWFRADDLPVYAPVTGWVSAYPAGGITLAPIDPLGAMPFATGMPMYNAANYNTTVDFTGSVDAANMALVYAPTGTINLLNNSTSTAQGTMFVVYYIPDPAVPISPTGQHIMQYRESNTSGDGIQFRRLAATNRIAIGNSGNVNATRDFTESFKPTILSYKGNYLSTMGAYQNNKTIPTATVASSSTGYKGLYIGTRRHQTSGNYEGSFPGYISEIIFYDTNLSVADFARVNSYLAIKYGITLDNTSSAQGGNGNYVASDGTLIWDGAVGSAYQNDVIGIGLDIDEGLFQKQSHSFNDSQRLYIGALSPTNADNFAAVSYDKSYVMLGHNNAATCNATGNTEYPAGYGIYSRIDREWKLTRTNFIEDFNIDIVLDPCINTANLLTADLQLLVDYDDGDFSNATVFNSGAGVMFGLSGNTLTLYSLPVSVFPATGTAYFTIASANSSTPLPVNNIDLKAKAVAANAVQLNWTSTVHCSGFRAERSADAHQWNTVGTVSASAGSESNAYHLTDNTVQESEYYYRITGTDAAGKTYQSAIRKVSLGKYAAPGSLYPNPAQKTVTIQTAERISHWQVTDMFGRNVTALCAEVGGEAALRLDISRLAAGTYMIVTDAGRFLFVKS